MLKKTVLKSIAFTLAFMLSATLGACSLFDYGEDTQELPLSTPIPVSVSKSTVIRGTIEIGINGRAEIVSHSGQRYYFSDVSGYITSFPVNMGDYVNAGDVLVTAQTYTGTPVSLVAETAGYVRYVNTAYKASDDASLPFNPGETMAVVDPEIVTESFAVIEYDVVNSDCELGIGDVITMTAKSKGDDGSAEFTGTIVGSSETGDDLGWRREVLYYVSLENAPESLSVGDSISYSYIEASSEDCVMIAAEHLFEFSGREFVYVLDEAGIKRERYVKTGLRNELFVEIISGLEEGEQIVAY